MLLAYTLLYSTLRLYVICFFRTKQAVDRKKKSTIFILFFSLRSICGFAFLNKQKRHQIALCEHRPRENLHQEPTVCVCQPPDHILAEDHTSF